MTLSNKRLALSACIISHPKYHITSQTYQGPKFVRQYAPALSHFLTQKVGSKFDPAIKFTIRFEVRHVYCINFTIRLEVFHVCVSSRARNTCEKWKNWEIRGACPPPIRFEVSLWANFLFLFIPLMSEEQNNDLQPKACWASFSSLMGVFCVSEPVCVSVAKWRSDTLCGCDVGCQIWSITRALARTHTQTNFTHTTARVQDNPFRRFPKTALLRLYLGAVKALLRHPDMLLACTPGRVQHRTVWRPASQPARLYFHLLKHGRLLGGASLKVSMSRFIFSTALPKIKNKT